MHMKCSVPGLAGCKSLINDSYFIILQGTLKDSFEIENHLLGSYVGSLPSYSRFGMLNSRIGLIRRRRPS